MRQLFGNRGYRDGVHGVADVRAEADGGTKLRGIKIESNTERDIDKDKYKYQDRDGDNVERYR